MAFKGTDLDQANDLKTDYEQAVGKVGDQYRIVSTQVRAIQSLAESLGAKLIATGHSLGGGLATALASSGFVDRAVVFNPAGLHENTAAAFEGSIDNAAKVTTKYVSRWDVLNFAQQYDVEVYHFPVGLVLPNSVGEERIISGAGLHGLDSFMEPFGLAN